MGREWRCWQGISCSHRVHGGWRSWRIWRSSNSSPVIADFADGEISQATALFNTDITFEDYNVKSHQKTGSLIAASCKSAVVFSDVPLDVKDDM